MMENQTAGVANEEVCHMEVRHMEVCHLADGHINTGHIESGHIEIGHIEIGRRQDCLMGALIGLARACTSNPRTEETDRVLVKGLAGSVFRDCGDEKDFEKLIAMVKEAKDKAAPGCAMCTARCGNTDDYDMERLWNSAEDVRTVKTLLLYSLRQMACLVLPVMEANQLVDAAVMDFFYKGLFVLAEDWERDLFLSSVLDIGRINRICMETWEKWMAEGENL